MKTKTLALTAIAGLALPGAAFAAQPDEPGKQGRDTAAAKQLEHKSRMPVTRARPPRARRSRSRASASARFRRGRQADRVAHARPDVGQQARPQAARPVEGRPPRHRDRDLRRDRRRGRRQVRRPRVARTPSPATDRVKVIGKVVDGELDIRRIKIKRSDDDS